MKHTDTKLSQLGHRQRVNGVDRSISWSEVHSAASKRTQNQVLGQISIISPVVCLKVNIFLHKQ